MDNDSKCIQRARSFLNMLGASPTEDDFAVSQCDIFWTFVSIIARVIGIVLTINLAVDYFLHDRIHYFAWTICCFVIPMIITVFIQISIYLDDCRNSKKPPRSACGVLWYVILCPVLFRYVQTVRYAIASKKAENRKDKLEQKRYFELLIQEDSDVALIRLFDCFLEVAPQKVLQISIILSGEDEINVPQTLALLSSIFSMAWCIASYHRCIRLSQVDKINISWWGTIFQSLWHFLVTVSRVLSIAIVASLFPIWTLLSFCTHALVMAAWIFVFDKSPFCSSSVIHSFLFSIVLGFVFIFNYILPRVRRTQYRYAVFYTICFIENVACVTLYCLFASRETVHSNYFIPMCVMSIFPFLLGILFMVIYYTRFHPNIVSRKEMVSASELTNDQ